MAIPELETSTEVQNGHLPASTFIPESIDFWRELKIDLESFNGVRRGLTLRNFLLYYHPENNRMAAGRVMSPGKYRDLAAPFYLPWLRKLDTLNLDEYLTISFSPPSEDPDFGEVVV